MTIADKTTTVIQEALGTVGNSAKQIELYQSQSKNPGLVADADAAVSAAVAALGTLSPTGTSAVVTSGQTVTGVTGTGTTATLTVTAGVLSIALS